MHQCGQAGANPLVGIQEQGLVPIVEPEILITSDYDMSRSREVSTQVLREVVRRLQEHKVDMKLCLLKPQMVMPGSDCPTQAGSDEVAAATLDVFDECLPSDLAGVFFLSGGLTEEQATVNLNKIKSRNHGPLSHYELPLACR